MSSDGKGDVSSEASRRRTARGWRLDRSRCVALFYYLLPKIWRRAVCGRQPRARHAMPRKQHGMQRGKLVPPFPTLPCTHVFRPPRTNGWTPTIMCCVSLAPILK
ncbi:unnamed protein product [Danaus chrysippus]|uniref:(African queen) hypothetical protein n=1 Tax=Danaus chrysippus TaxID=151541 RepID=A0A8J2WA10_9NEOP|nr:unnamed protein product [Danaus chrysippus]